MNLHARLRSLERSAHPAAPVACPECGGGGPGPQQIRLAPIPLPDVYGEPPREQPRSTRPDNCPRCGRALVVRLLPITLDEKW